MGEAPMSFRWAGGSYQSASRIMREKLDGTEFFREHEKMMSEIRKIVITSSSLWSNMEKKNSKKEE
jgi:hypothetical protein